VEHLRLHALWEPKYSNVGYALSARELARLNRLTLIFRRCVFTSDKVGAMLCESLITPDIDGFDVFFSFHSFNQQNQQLKLAGNAVKSRDLKIGNRVRSPRSY
jgi:hypothetical protein